MLPIAVAFMVIHDTYAVISCSKRCHMKGHLYAKTIQFDESVIRILCISSICTGILSSNKILDTILHYVTQMDGVAQLRKSHLLHRLREKIGGYYYILQQLPLELLTTAKRGVCERRPILSFFLTAVLSCLLQNWTF